MAVSIISTRRSSSQRDSTEDGVNRCLFHIGEEVPIAASHLLRCVSDEVIDDPGDPASLGVQISNPGYPGIDSGGQVFSAGVTAEVTF